MGTHSKTISAADAPNGTQRLAMSGHLLERARHHMKAWEAAEPGSLSEARAADEFTSAFGALDDWLSHGGPPPADWAGLDLPDRPVPDDLVNAEAQLYMSAVKSRHGEPTRDEIMRAFRLAFRALHDRSCEVQRLKAEMDKYHNHAVYFATQQQAEIIAAGGDPQPMASPGDFLRATDTGSEWVQTGTGWQAS